MKVIAPESWIIENPKRQWQAFSGRGVSQGFNVALTNITTIGRYELPIQIDLDSAPPRRITVYRKVDVGPEGVEIDVKTKLLERNGLVVQVEITNRTWKPKSFDCLLFPPAGRQFQERVMTIEPDTTMRREYFWPDAKKFLGQSMILRAVEQDGPRVINYRFRVRG